MLSLKAYLKLIYKPFLIVLFISVNALITYKIRLGGGFYICNQGIAFGIPLNIITSSLMLSIILVLLYIYYIKLLPKINILAQIGFFFILCGAISNLIDRLLYSCIIDYINIFPTIIPLFNIADIFIFMGSLSIFIALGRNLSNNCL